jgi:hypothetical protein
MMDLRGQLEIEIQAQRRCLDLGFQPTRAFDGENFYDVEAKVVLNAQASKAENRQMSKDAILDHIYSNGNADIGLRVGDIEFCLQWKEMFLNPNTRVLKLTLMMQTSPKTWMSLEISMSWIFSSHSKSRGSRRRHHKGVEKGCKQYYW